jgi:hypothetical protein
VRTIIILLHSITNVLEEFATKNDVMGGEMLIAILSGKILYIKKP